MPYFKKINLLFIHIPKTGGSNIENFFFCKLNENPSFYHIFSYNLNLRFNHHSLQHCTYQELVENQQFFNINFNNDLKILSVVRNPYERIISDLFFFKLTDNSKSQESIQKTIEYYLHHKSNFDNHKIPQYHFLIDKEGKIPPNIIILKNETLNEEMKKNGYPKFEYFCKDYTKKSYIYLLNEKSIKMINTYYKRDFECFNYEMIDFK